MNVLGSINARAYTVSQLTALIRGRLEEEFFEVWVEGEVSDLRVPSSGHVYFMLKDQQAQLRCVLFKGNQRFLRFQPEDGMSILARGKITVYDRRGEYQLMCDYLEPLGSGALQKAFEQLKERLANEGLFDQARKRPIPFWPERIGIVTSPTGAAIRDILNILNRRFAAVHVLINPVRVQGEGAAQEIAQAIRELEVQPGVEVIILARGGGSIEDLWAFNEEVVARAIFSCRVPVISAVGHEIDYTISDFVADLRAPTPSAAAELVVQHRQQLEEHLATLEKRLLQVVMHRVEMSRTRVRHLIEGRAFRDPLSLIRSNQESVDEQETRLLRAMSLHTARCRERTIHAERLLARLHPSQTLTTLRACVGEHERRLGSLMRTIMHQRRQALAAAMGALDALSPLGVLKRGYSLCWRLPDEKIVRTSADLETGDTVRLRFHRGGAVCEVKRREESSGPSG
ncbi:MAG: exodeoxyribonuclease VII large subunit [bacterium]